MHTRDQEIENFLIDSGMLTKNSLEGVKKISSEKGESLGRVLLDKGLLSEDDLRRLEAFIVGVPFVDLKSKELELDTLSLIPEPLARSCNIVAVRKVGKSLEVAMLDLNDADEVEFIKDKYGLKISPRLTDGESMKQALITYQKLLKTEFGDVIKSCVSNLDEDPDAPAMLLDTLIKHAVVEHASDIHIEGSKNDTYVRYRIEGRLYDAMVLPNFAGSAVSARLKEVANLELNSESEQEGRFTVEIDGEKISIRITILPTRYGDKIVLRLLRQSSSGFSLETLGVNQENIEKIHEALRERTGLIIVAGPDVSGKTTMLYTLLDMLNRSDVSVSSIEEEIEFELPRVNQTEIAVQNGFTYAKGLRSLLRQDTDVIMVSDLPDEDTASLAVVGGDRSLVLAGMRANSIKETLSKLLSFGIDPDLIASSLKLIIFTKLLPRLDENKEKYILNPQELSTLGKVVSLDQALSFIKSENLVLDTEGWESAPFYRSRYAPRGFVGMHEMLRITPSLRQFISSRDMRKLDSSLKEAVKPSLIEDGLLKAVRGDASLEEVLAAWKEAQS